MSTPQNFPLEIDVASVHQLQTAGVPFLLLDCREADEVSACSIKGSVHISMREIAARLAELEPHKGERIVVHCHHGGRSMRITQWLRQQGWETVQNMAGGIDAWSQQIDPSVPRY